MLRRLALTLLLCFVFAAFASAENAPPPATFASVLSGKVVPLTLKLKQLNGNWRVFTYSSTSQESQISAIYGLPGGGNYTKGQTLTVGGETYLVTYTLENKNAGVLSLMMGRGGAQPQKLTANSVVRLSLLNVRNLGSLNDIRRFNLKTEIARYSQGYQSVQNAVTMRGSSAPNESEPPEARDATAQNLKNMALAIQMYTVDYDALPPMSDPEQFRAVVADYVSDEQIFKDPKRDEYFALNPALSGQTAPTDDQQAAETVVAYQVTPDDKGNRWVAFADGHVKKQTAKEWEALKAKAGIR